MTYPSDLRQELLQHFRMSFDDMYLRDIRLANDADVRMGTFIMCAAFLDALSLCYSAGEPVRGGPQAMWRRFTRRYLGPDYDWLESRYHDFRSRLLHNYGPVGVGFTHGPEQASRHLQEINGSVYLHRESFVRDVEPAFEAFRTDVFGDPVLGARVAEHLRRYPPLAFSILVETPLAPAVAASANNSLTRGA